MDARALLPETLAFVPFGFGLVRVRVTKIHKYRAGNKAQ
jgi:hypothetical protein